MLLALMSLNALNSLVTCGSTLNSGWRVDPERDLPYDALRKISWAGSARHLFPLLRPLEGMLLKGEPYDGEVRLLDVRGISASKSDYLTNLDAVPDSMNLVAGETFGPFDDTGMTRLREAVEREFGRSGVGRFGLYRQYWDGLLIARNSGASRRFSLWRRLARRTDPGLTIPASIIDISISGDMLDLLRTHRVTVIRTSAVPMIDFPAIADRWRSMSFAPTDADEGVLVLPKPETMPLLASWLARIHSRLEQDGCFDLARYLADHRDLWKPEIIRV